MNAAVLAVLAVLVVREDAVAGMVVVVVQV